MATVVSYWMDSGSTPKSTNFVYFPVDQGNVAETGRSRLRQPPASPRRPEMFSVEARGVPRFRGQFLSNEDRIRNHIAIVRRILRVYLRCEIRPVPVRALTSRGARWRLANERILMLSDQS
jgi:hypothetical protein